MVVPIFSGRGGPQIPRFSGRAARPWYLSPAYAGMTAIEDYNNGRYAITSVAQGSIGAASTASLTTLKNATQTDFFGQFVASGTTTRPYLDGGNALRNDLAANAPRFDNLNGKSELLLENALTNKVTCRKVNPVDTAGTNFIGAPAALTVVNDAAALASAGLQTVCTNGLVYKCDNTAGTGAAWFILQGQTGNTNTHTASAYARASGSGCTIGGGGTGGLSGKTTPISQSGYTYVSVTGTPGTTACQLQVNVAAGQAAWVILPGMHEQAYAPAYPIADNTLSSITRPIETFQEDSISLALVSRSEFSIVIRARLLSIAGGVLWQADDGTANNRITIKVSAGALVLEVVSGGTTTATVTTANTITANTPFGVAARVKANNFGICLNGGAVASSASGVLPTGLTQSALARNLVGTLSYADMRADFKALLATAVNDATLQGLAVAA